MVAPASTGKTRLSAYEHLPRPVRRNSRSGTPSNRRKVSTSSSEFAVASAAFSTTLKHKTHLGSDASSSLVSPTHVTHAVPRPKSPRAPRPSMSAAQVQARRGNDQKNNNHGSGTLNKRNLEMFRAQSASPPRRTQRWNTNNPVQPLLSAQHFSAVIQKPNKLFASPGRASDITRKQDNSSFDKPSPDRSKSTVASGETTSTATSTTSTPERSYRRHRHQARAVSPPRRTLRSRGSRSSKNSSNNSLAKGESLLRGCIAGGLAGTAVVGSKFVECLYISTDIYQQECGPHQSRGGDGQFLERRNRDKNNSTETNNPDDEDDDDIVVKDPPSLSGTRARRGRASPTLRSRRSRSVSTARQSTDNGMNVTPFRSNRRSDLVHTGGSQPSTPTLYNRHEDSFDVAPHGMLLDQGELPRLHSRNRNSSWTDENRALAVQNDPLRNVRLGMFLDTPGVSPTNTLPPKGLLGPKHHRRNQSWDGSSSDVGSKPSFPPWRQLPASPHTDNVDVVLRRELEETKKSLARAREDLQHAHELALRQKVDTQDRASQLITQKIAVETKLQQEEREKNELLAKLSALQEETVRLKSSLKQVQKEGFKRSPDRKPPLSPTLINQSPQRALADSLVDESSVASREENKRAVYDSGAVLNLVREVVASSSSSQSTPTIESPPSRSPVSVLDMAERTNEVDFHTPPRGVSEATPTGSPFLSSQLISLKSELIEMRSQLAEANAAKIEAETKSSEAEKANEVIQRETKKLRDEVNELKQLVLNLKMDENEKAERHEKTVREVKQELVKSQELIAVEQRAKEKLEEELTETQSETLELRGQVARFMKELEKTKNESEQKIKVSEFEAEKLQQELRQMKQRLSETNAEIVQQAAEHLKKRQEIEAELEQSKATTTALQRRVLFMDDQLASAESVTECLRKRILSTPPTTPPRTTWKQKLGDIAESLSRSLSEGMEDAPIVVPESSPFDASVIGRLRHTLESKQLGSSA